MMPLRVVIRACLDVGKVFLDAIAPPRCASCDAFIAGDREAACADCLPRIPLSGHRICPQCGARRILGTPPCHEGSYRALIAATSYASREAQALVKALKYDGIRVAADTMALLTVVAARNTLEEELRAFANPAGQWGDWIAVPVPLHPRRERERGFNQSLLFAEALVRHESLRGVPVVRALRRARNTDTQTEKRDYGARRANVAGCFETGDIGAARGKNVLLIDDVTTSGATLEEAARVLKRAGARRVTALVFAKA